MLIDVSIIESLFACSWSATFCLKDASIFALILLFSIIFRKSSWENDDTRVESSFVIDAVADVSLVSVVCLDIDFFFLWSITRNDASFSMSYETRMWHLYASCAGCRNWMVEDVDSFCRAVV